MPSDLPPIAEKVREVLARRRATLEAAAPPELLERERRALLASHAKRRRAAWPAHLRACGAPDRVVSAVEARAFKTTKAVQFVRAFMEGPKTFCVLLSETPGAGKTFAACAALWWAERAWKTHPHPLADPVELKDLDSRRGLFVLAPRLTWAPRAEGSILLRAIDVPILVLDELAIEVLDERAREKLETLFIERDAARRKTVITSNAKQAQLAERLGDRVADRLAADAAPFTCGAVSLRRHPEKLESDGETK